MTDSKPSTSSNKRTWLWCISTGLMTLLSGGLLTWWLAYPTHLMIGSIVTIALALGLSILTFWLKNRASKSNKEQDKQRLLINKRSKLLALHFKKMLAVQKRKKRLTSRYDQPIYLLLSDDPSKDKSIITQMGYEAYKVDDFGNDIEFPILFWLSDHSILISVSMNDEQQPQYLKTLCDCLNSWRPRQALNGLILTIEVAHLLGNRDILSQRADEIKSVINTFCERFGLKIPIYNIITNMGQISDFCQFFSAFDESKRNEVFGATSPVLKNGGIDADWFDQEYDHLIGQLIASMNGALSAQLNQEYRNAICAAPFQFGLLKQSLWSFLQRLYRGDQLTNGLNFRGFYFTHSGSDEEQHDLLANVVNDSLGNERYQQHQQLPVGQTLFAQHIMNHVILNENTLVGVNSRKENMLLFWQGAYTLGCFSLLLFVLTVIKLDFDYQNAREAKADAMLERYKEAISAAPYDIENMSDNIPNLYSLYRIYNMYRQPDPWYTFSIMPSSSIQHDVESAYFTELERVLIPSMENTLEKDLFVYVNLEDQAKTLSLLNSYRLLFNAKRTNINELKAYFMNTLQEQGETDTTTLAQLKVLLDDVFAQDLVPIKPNYDLESLAQKVINQTGIETLLYEHILQSSIYSKRVDIRQELGDNFSELLAFSPNYAGYLVPYLYTPSGFNELDLSVGSPILNEALRAYEGVAGTSPSALEMYRVSRDLKQMYQTDYISYWRDFISHINTNGIDSPDLLKSRLSVLTTASNNPLTDLYSTISKYTSVEVKVPETKDDSELPPEQDSNKKETARQIYLAFSAYHKQVIADDQGNKPIDQLLGKFTGLENWLDNFYSAKDPQKTAFEALTAKLKVTNPVSELMSITSSQPNISLHLMQSISAQTNEMILSLAHQYLNSQWQSNVFEVYQKNIAAYYPFNNASDLDASTSDVANFFKTNGTLDTFYQSKLKSFNSDEQSPFLPGLLPNTGLALDPEVWQMINKAEDIRNALFLVDPQNLSIQFQIKASEMSSNLTEFSIIAEKPIFSYKHGPRIWSKQTWSGSDIDKDQLSVKVKAINNTINDEQAQGTWAWFRLLEPRVISATSQNTKVKFIYDDKQQVDLELKTQGQNNPFVPKFFSAFTLPANI